MRVVLRTWEGGVSFGLPGFVYTCPNLYHYFYLLLLLLLLYFFSGSGSIVESAEFPHLKIERGCRLSGGCVNMGNFFRLPRVSSLLKSFSWYTSLGWCALHSL